MRIEEPAVETADSADVAEQRAEADDPAPDDSAPDDVAGSGGPELGALGDLPLEANEADVVEQEAEVPFDERER